MPQLKIISFTTLFILILYQGYCQQQDSIVVKQFHLSGFPVVYYSPETKLAYGVLGIIAFRNLQYRQKYPSQVQLGAAYTTNKQLLLYMPFRVYACKDHLAFYGELGYYKYSYYFYGIGNNQAPDYKELYKVNYPRVRLNLLTGIHSKLYIGLRYWYENYSIVEKEAGKQLATDLTITGSSGGVTSGVGPVINIDTRDNLFSPSHGWFLDAGFQFYSKSTGSTFHYNRFSFDLSKYYAVGKKSVIAANLFTDVVEGNAPFNQLALLGGNKKMRGYYEGRYRDKDLVELGLEYRFPVYRRFGAVVFYNAGAVDNTINHIVEHVVESYGLGLRYLLNKKDKINLRFDAAYGYNSSGYYFTIGEAF